MTPKTNYIRFGGHQKTQHNLRHNHESLLKCIILGILKMLKIVNLKKTGKDVRRKMLKVRLTFLNILSMGAISLKKHKI